MTGTKPTSKGRKIIVVIVALYEFGPDDEVHAAAREFILDEHEGVNLVGCLETMSVEMAGLGMTEIRWLDRIMVRRVHGQRLRQVYKSLDQIPHGGEAETTTSIRVIRFNEKEEDDDRDD